jgi:hypothetical protein
MNTQNEMIRKFYDAEYDGSAGGVFVVNQKTLSEKTIIECQCGTHLLQVQSETDIYENSDGSKRAHQDFYLAMFSYGNQKRNIWDRIAIAFKYLRTGKMFADQLTLNPDEAKKLSDFITSNLLK